jgi:hypothetical protein
MNIALTPLTFRWFGLPVVFPGSRQLMLAQLSGRLELTPPNTKWGGYVKRFSSTFFKNLSAPPETRLQLQGSEQPLLVVDRLAGISEGWKMLFNLLLFNCLLHHSTQS